MKKAYINPKIVIVELTAHKQILAGSIGRGNTPTDAGGSDARRDDFDFDDFDEEY